MLRPRHQVGRRERVEKQLLTVRRGKGRIDPVLPVEYVRLRIGVPTRQNRIAGPRRLHGQDGHERDQAQNLHRRIITSYVVRPTSYVWHACNTSDVRRKTYDVN